MNISPLCPKQSPGVMLSSHLENSHTSFKKAFLAQGGEYLNVPLSILFPFLLTLDAG